MPSSPPLSLPFLDRWRRRVELIHLRAVVEQHIKTWDGTLLQIGMLIETWIGLRFGDLLVRVVCISLGMPITTLGVFVGKRGLRVASHA